MKPAKAHSRNYMDILKNPVEKEIREKKTETIRAYIRSERLRTDPEFKKLRGYFGSLKIHQNVKNELVDLLEENNLEIWNLYHDTDARSFEAYKKGFLGGLKYNLIKGPAKVEIICDQEIQEIRKAYNATVIDVGGVPIKQEVVYPEELGLSVDALEEEEVQLPMVAIDRSKL